MSKKLLSIVMLSVILVGLIVGAIVYNNTKAAKANNNLGASCSGMECETSLYKQNCTRDKKTCPVGGENCTGDNNTCKPVTK